MSAMGEFSTPDLADGAPAARALLLPWRDFGARERFAGAAVTVKCFEDNSRVRELAAEAGAGRVMVVDGARSLRRALLGDRVAASAAAQGWAGILIAGAVRDVELLRDIDLGIKALGACPQKTDKRGEGQVGLPLEIGGAVVNPGDFIYADASGVLVSATALR